MMFILIGLRTKMCVTAAFLWFSYSTEVSCPCFTWQHFSLLLFAGHDSNTSIHIDTIYRRKTTD
uniref:Secreted protein n=1 Tax=Utricularia reniformis TaxID=192314 RepID=A0A1Y0B1L3_9LAMI|nr:hypothetical protein AEK19_MT1045 [Utricularia reniformis]ART31268.1 hypothetical protein AEK19_MT1045 [Utricularia reniformis]